MRWTSALFLAGSMFAAAAYAIPTRIDPNAQHRVPAEQPPGSIVNDLHDMLHGGEEARAHDPIGALTHDMDGIVDDLDHDHTDAPVQGEQKQVVSRLDKLIEQLNKQCNGNGGGSNNPSKPMSDSRIAKGPGGSGPMHDPKAGTKSWGQLPPKDREQILQSQNQGFPAGYENLLSSYYNRLAQEQVGDDARGATTRTAN